MSGYAHLSTVRGVWNLLKHKFVTFCPGSFDLLWRVGLESEVVGLRSVDVGRNRIRGGAVKAGRGGEGAVAGM